MACLLLAVLTCLLLASADAQCSMVSTLAGSSTPGSVDGQGTAARFAEPWGISVSSGGTTFIGDKNNYVVRAITSGGLVSTFAGSGTRGFANGQGAAASFRTLRGVAVSSDGTVFVADALNCAIRAITPGGYVSTLAGNPVGVNQRAGHRSDV